MVKLVTIISVISTQEGKTLLKSLLSEERIENIEIFEILSLLSKGRYFRGGRYFGNFTVLNFAKIASTQEDSAELSFVFFVRKCLTSCCLITIRVKKVKARVRVKRFLKPWFSDLQRERETGS